jgi:hypothetical protein
VVGLTLHHASRAAARIEVLTSQGDDGHTKSFIGLRLIEHSTQFDYAIGESNSHRIVLGYDDMELI